MKYYVLYDNINSCEMELEVVEQPGDVVAFIETLIHTNKYSIADFRVIEGIDLALKAVVPLTRVTLVPKTGNSHD